MRREKAGLRSRQGVDLGSPPHAQGKGASDLNSRTSG